MNEILDLLPIPADRDLPPGRLEARRDALVAATRAEAARDPVARRVLRAAREQVARTWWLSLLGILALGIAVVCTGFRGQQPAQRGAEALLVVAGVAQVAAAVAPGDGAMSGFLPSDPRRLAVA